MLQLIAYHRHSVSRGRVGQWAARSLMQTSSSRILFSGFSLLAFTLAACVPSSSDNPAQSAPPQITAPANAMAEPAQAAPPPAPPQPSAHEQRVRQLIKQVDQAYAQGQAAYHKGDLVNAKTYF